MASTINSTTTGVKITSDTSGALNIQVGGVDAIQIGTNASVTIGTLSSSSVISTGKAIAIAIVFGG